MPRKDRVAGVRSTERAVVAGKAAKVYVARDAEDRVTRHLVLLCKEKGVEVGFVGSMREIGESCGLRVGASCCAVLVLPE